MKFLKNLPSPFAILKNQRGVALILAFFVMILITYLVSEITYDTTVEYTVNAGAVNQLKAHYAAKSALDLSLLRIKIYQQVASQFGSQVSGSQRKLLDMIWNFPFAWPPILPESLSETDKGLIQDKVKLSQMQSSFMASISDEGSKIDLNDLDSPSETIRKNTKELLLGIFKNKMENDREWAEKHSDLKYEELINNIIDWVDADTNAVSGGNEADKYSNIKFNDASETLPPNRSFRTIDELRLVPEITDELFLILKDRVTIYGMKAINPNTARREVLAALDPGLTKEVLDEIIKRREDSNLGGPFTAADEFWDYAASKGARLSESSRKNTALIFNEMSSFSIKAVGNFASATKEINAVVLDINQVAKSVSNSLVKEIKSKNSAAGQTDPQNPQPNNDKSNNPNPNSSPGAGPSSPNPLPKGPPRIVYLYER
jgi:general secretion pathway protein K